MQHVPEANLDLVAPLVDIAVTPLTIVATRRARARLEAALRLLQSAQMVCAVPYHLLMPPVLVVHSATVVRSTDTAAAPPTTVPITVVCLHSGPVMLAPQLAQMAYAERFLPLMLPARVAPSVTAVPLMGTVEAQRNTAVLALATRLMAIVTQ